MRRAWFRVWGLPIVSIVVPFLGLTKYMLRILQGSTQKGTKWRLQVDPFTGGACKIRYLAEKVPEVGCGNTQDSPV